MDFALFCKRLDNLQIDDAKQQVTVRNANILDGRGFGILWYVCAHGPDDPALFQYFVGLVGSLFGGCGDDVATTPLHKAANAGKPKILRAILDLNIICVDAKTNYNQRTPLYWAVINYKFDCARLLIDAGASPHHLPLQSECVMKFVAARHDARLVSIIVLALQRCAARSFTQSGNGKDVLRMVARCVWSTRGEEESWIIK